MDEWSRTKRSRIIYHFVAILNVAVYIFTSYNDNIWFNCMFFSCSFFFFFYHRCAVCVIWKHWLWALIKLFWCLVLSRVGDFVNVFLTTGFCTFEIKRWKVSRNVASQMWKIITCNSLSENAKSFSSCFFFFFFVSHGNQLWLQDKNGGWHGSVYLLWNISSRCFSSG